ncbi:hypothetical protein FVQ98_00545 [Ottowia sp. GY511]|uniref:Uncharacterized protein n=1 Tax=Ottowia flava TaxID=2675430 RepID=A0ABW4KXI9_9BURK|nr:hypothetical protein [Ottowia sp. GY511]TXK33405.1 hypothetical protein FVQ98_00545 [Ottowia sp. GY511]
MSPAARPTGLSPRLVQVLAMFVDIAAAQAAALEAEAAPGVCWVRVVKPQAILRSVDARATHSAIAPIRTQEPAYVKRVADLARAQRAGLLVDCNGADSAAVVTALGHSGALVAFVAGAQGVRELTLAQSAPGVTEWRRAA